MRHGCLGASRYEKLENKVLAESTVAGQNASVQYLAACAALQQWEQSALAYLLLHTAPGPLSVERLSAAVESLLEDNFSVSFLDSFLLHDIMTCGLVHGMWCSHCVLISRYSWC